MKHGHLRALLSTIIAFPLITGCGSTVSVNETASSTVAAQAQEDLSEASSTVIAATDSSEASGYVYQINESLDNSKEVQLDIVGPGLFEHGAEGTTDLTSGIFIPGWNEIEKRWNELYPNVKLNFNICPWQDWQSSITTACLDGSADVIMHGATMIDLTEDLAPYLANEPDYRNQLFALATRRTTEHPNQWKVSGISVYTAPMVIWVDTQKFSDFGVKLPEDGWTMAEMIDTAKSLTGKNPKTGEDCFGIQLPFAGSANLFFNYMLNAYIYGAKTFTYGSTLKDCIVDFTGEEQIKAFQAIADEAKYQSPEANEGGTVSKTLDGNNNWAMMGSNTPIQNYFEMKAAGLEGRYKAYNYPIIESGEYEGAPSPYFGDINVSIFKDSDEKEWSWEFIKFLTTDEVATQWVVDQLVYPNNKGAKAAVEKNIDSSLLDVMEHAMSTMPENFNGSTNDNFNNVSFGPVTNNLITAVDDVINGRQTPEEASRFMSEIVNEYMLTAE